MKLSFSPQALQDAKTLLPGVPKAKLIEMVSESAPCTHARGNRRYHDFIFNVKKGQVTGIAPRTATGPPKSNCRECGGTRKATVFDPCPMCMGKDEGCKYCDFKGGKQIEIPCQYCRNSS